jgi:hypothetical protein
MSDLGPTWNNGARKLSLAARRGGIPLFPLFFSEEITCCGYRNDFFKKSGGLLFTAKVQNHPASSEIGRNLRKIQIIPPKAAATKQSWYAYLRWSTINVGCCSHLSILCFGSCFIKKPYFSTLKMEKALFVRPNENRPLWLSSKSQGPRACDTSKTYLLSRTLLLLFLL